MPRRGRSADEFRTAHAERSSEPSRCELCGRAKRLTKHHLIPRAVHGRNRYRRQFSQREMQQRSIMICQLCHHGIHDLIPDEKQLADEFNTLAALLAHEGVQRHVAWVRKQK